MRPLIERCGLVINPIPRGVFSPSDDLARRLTDVLAAKLFLILGFRIPNFIERYPQLRT